MKSSVKYLRRSAPLISVSGGRFPPAWPQPLPPLRSVQGLRLMLFRQESRANRTRKASKRNIARRKSGFLFQGRWSCNRCHKCFRWDELAQSQDVAFLDCRPPLQSTRTQHILDLCESNFSS